MRILLPGATVLLAAHASWWGDVPREQPGTWWGQAAPEGDGALGAQGAGGAVGPGAVGALSPPLRSRPLRCQPIVVSSSQAGVWLLFPALCSLLTLPSPSQLLGKAGISPLPGSVCLGAPSPFPLPLCLRGPASSCMGCSTLSPAAVMPMDCGCARARAGAEVVVGLLSGCAGRVAAGNCGIAGGASGGGDRLALE